MEIITTTFSNRKAKSSVSDYVEACLSDTLDSGGIAESAVALAEANSKALGRLLETLAEKGLLTAPEIVFIAGGYSRGEAEFV